MRLTSLEGRRSDKRPMGSRRFNGTPDAVFELPRIAEKLEKIDSRDLTVNDIEKLADMADVCMRLVSEYVEDNLKATGHELSNVIRSSFNVMEFANSVHNNNMMRSRRTNGRRR